MIKLNLPSWVVVGLGLLAGIAEYVVLNVPIVQPWKTGAAVVVLMIGGLGISPLMGAAFTNALHISHNLAQLITAAVTALGLAVTTLSMSSELKGVLVGLLAFLATVGFGSTGITALRTPPPAVRA